LNALGRRLLEQLRSCDHEFTLIRYEADDPAGPAGEVVEYCFRCGESRTPATDPQPLFRHVGLGDLIGSVIEGAYETGNTIYLSLNGREGRRFRVAVMSDPEGNGPGSLHVSDCQLMTFLGSLGGR
jgi:hypothetical protein